MALATASTWRYDLPSAESSAPRHFHGNLWRGLCRFLLIGKRGSGLRLHTDGRVFHRNEQVKVQTYLNINLNSESSPQSIPLIIRHGDEEQQIFLNPSPDNPSRYEGTFRPQQMGEYILKVEAGAYQDERTIRVTPPEQEFRVTHQNVALLKSISEVSGGRYFSANEAAAIEQAFKFKPEVETFQRSVFIGSLPWILPLLVALISAEWVLRKRESLP